MHHGDEKETDVVMSAASWGVIARATPRLGRSAYLVPRRMTIAGREPGKRTNPEPESHSTRGRCGRQDGEIAVVSRVGECEG